MSEDLDAVVTAAATALMSADAATSAEVSRTVLADIVAHFDLDLSFLRYNEHDVRASRLIAEWPPRVDVPDPDPIALVSFVDADPVFAQAEHAKEIRVFRPEPATEDFQKLIEKASGIPDTTLAAVPLVSGQVTTGTLGFVKFGDREWHPPELNALHAIATLFAQVQARVVAEERLRELADHDDLTGLANRRSLMAHLARRLTPDAPAAPAAPVTVLYLDLDRLKVVNDYLGHVAGDAFIRAFARRLCEESGDADLMARLGGDEFVVVPAAALQPDEAVDLAARVQRRLRERICLDGEYLVRTVSVGVAQGLPGVDDASDLLRRADQALLDAKKAGGNQIAVFNDEMSLRSHFRNDIEVHLQGVLESGSLVLRYLPEVDLRTGEILATEALVRWWHPTRGLLLPDSFIGVAESINLAGEIGRWVLRTACEAFSRWRREGAGAHVSLRVNVSPVQLVTDGFADVVTGILEEFGLDGASVCLEITESVVVQDLETTRVTLAELRATGVRIAIDDFGTGYSALTHLKRLPVDTVKIDRGFVGGLGADPDDLAIVRAVVALADAFGLQLVAEGVQTVDAARALLALGCHRAQGFLLSRPVTDATMSAMLRRGRIDLPFTPA